MWRKNGPFWHVYTDGTLMEDIFCSAEDFNLGMTLLAVCAVINCKVELITFELMNNHVHLIMRGELADCLEFFDVFKRRLNLTTVRKDIKDYAKMDPMPKRD